MGPKTAKKKWYSVSVEAEKVAEEAVENVFGILDALGTTSQTLNQRNSQIGESIAYFDEKPDESEIESQLDAGMILYGLEPSVIRNVTVDIVVEQDWLAEWKKYWKPTRSGPFLVVPPWEQFPEKGLIEIRIEPSMAFGTGTHESTRLCLELIGDHFAPGMSFLDVGTGTGILCIAAAAMSRGKTDSIIYGCDTDAEAVGIARKNAALNGVGPIEFDSGPISEDTPRFDFVCANMTVDIIEPLLPQLLRIAGQRLVLSGILAEQEQRILDRLRACDAGNASILRKGEWIAVLLRS